ncbi:MAG TPA: hypothetical protein VKL99_01635 [Candidatus Angelobacter sp.]|nr:hypothetical protein [Candidatus Angelobacter sp.]
MKRFWIVCLSVPILLSSGFLLLRNSVQAEKSDAPALKPTYDIPFEVPGKAGDHNPPEFYLFSWEEFFALNWPATVPTGQPPLRGVPDTDKTIGDSGPRVWETWKSDFELFPAQPGYPGKIIQPTPWNSWDQPEPVCGAEHPAAGAKLLPLLAKGESVIPGGVNQAMGGPLVDQHLQYVRYEIRVNETEYNETKDKQWFLRKNLSTYPKPRNEFSSSHPGHYGPIEIKASWRILTDAEANATPPRFYMSKAWVVDPKHPTHCTQVTVGLVGLHIAHKTEQFPAWVWSTFEQVDNVPSSDQPPAQGYSFNNSKASQPAEWGFCVVHDGNCPTPPDSDITPQSYAPVAPQDLPIPPKWPIQTARVNPIPANGATELNRLVHELPGIKGTVWQYYELVAGQWQNDAYPHPPIKVSNPASSEDLYSQLKGFPADAVANVTMETFFQGKTPGDPTNLIDLRIFGTSCLHCHYQAAQYDFSWVLADAAWPSAPASQGPFHPKGKSAKETKPKPKTK